MISNNFYYYALLFTSVFFMLLFFVFFVLFIYKELGGVKIGRDSFLFFDYMLFGTGWKANIPALSVFFITFLSVVQDYILNSDFKAIRANVIGILAAFLLFIHCRYLSGVHYNNDGKIKFLKEFFFGGGVKLHFVVLWLSRLLYIAFFILHYYKDGY
ncbi:hypothetical protein GTGU_04662 [Trabulsiella guamensis ATCC 49490]|uniref:Uncharacterized protein n=1 Tax=Trabulsiella guamensis ATCC 49490 TaxID=1005994 RepID=A0A084ZHI9_9ENTR|nr:hypothetical protein [Trabulsiella guamensis]KFB96933.1 hypothetical protein GTGU_04662 [Trabulsiella guamensis ATCC 49490]